MVRYKDGTESTRRVTMHWDPAHCAEPIALDGATAVHNGGSTWSSVQCSTWLSSGVWEIVVQTDDVDRPSLFLGVVTREHWATTQETDEDGDDMELLLFMVGATDDRKQWGAALERDQLSRRPRDGAEQDHEPTMAHMPLTDGRHLGSARSLQPAPAAARRAQSERLRVRMVRE